MLYHDLIQPAATVSALAASLQHEVCVPDKCRGRLRQIGTEARRIAALCRSALEGPSPPAPVRADRVAAECASSAQATFPGTVSLQAAPAVVNCDETGLRRALSNLLANACRAAGPGGRVVVRTGMDGQSSYVEVADSGPGFRASTVSAAGLGLYIVSHVARDAGATVVRARSELGGALVRIVFPTAESSTEPARP